MQTFNQEYPPSEGWGLDSNVFEVSGQIVVKVSMTSPQGAVVRSATVGVEERIEDAFVRARKLVISSLSLETLEPDTKPRSTQEKGVETARGTDFPSPEEEPLPSPDKVQPIAQSSDKPKRSDQEVEKAPGKIDGEADQLDPGVIAVLKDACESEDVPFKQPRNNEQALAWTRALREGSGITELTDDLVPEEPEEAVEEESDA